LFDFDFFVPEEWVFSRFRLPEEWVLSYERDFQISAWRVTIFQFFAHTCAFRLPVAISHIVLHQLEGITVLDSV
jgi:hypothetical protein